MGTIGLRWIHLPTRLTFIVYFCVIPSCIWHVDCKISTWLTSAEPVLCIPGAWKSNTSAFYCGHSNLEKLMIHSEDEITWHVFAPSCLLRLPFLHLLQAILYPLLESLRCRSHVCSPN